MATPVQHFIWHDPNSDYAVDDNGNIKNKELENITITFHKKAKQDKNWMLLIVAAIVAIFVIK